ACSTFPASISTRAICPMNPFPKFPGESILRATQQLGWAACSGAAHTLAEQQLAHGGSPQEQSLVVELLGQVLLVETSVLMLRQLEDPGAHLWRQRLPRLPTALALHQSTPSVPLSSPLAPTHL